MVVIATVMQCKQLILCTNLKENLLQCVVHNLEGKPTTHGNAMGLLLVLVLLVISIVVVVLLLFPFISIVVVGIVGKIVGTRALFRLEEPSAPET